MDIENDLVDATPKGPEYREIIDSDIISIMKDVYIYNQDNVPYKSFDSTYTESMKDIYSENEWREIYTKSKEEYEFRTGQRYIMKVEFHEDPVSMTITRLFEDEFDTIKEKYLISPRTGGYYLKLKD